MSNFLFDECILIKQAEKLNVDISEMLNLWKCKEGSCSRCGWNIHENARRNQYMNEHRLQKNEQGLKQLRIVTLNVYE